MGMEFHQKTETLERTQAEVKMELKNPMTQLGISKEKPYKQNESSRK